MGFVLPGIPEDRDHVGEYRMTCASRPRNVFASLAPQINILNADSSPIHLGPRSRCAWFALVLLAVMVRANTHRAQNSPFGRAPAMALPSTLR